jgi:hypothetical protein
MTAPVAPTQSYWSKLTGWVPQLFRQPEGGRETAIAPGDRGTLGLGSAGWAAAPTEGQTDSGRDSLLSLMSLYASQYASYTTLLWQVPALGLTAQSFLLTIALDPGSSTGGRVIASLLGALIAGASMALMHDQRGRAIHYAGLLRRLAGSDGLGLGLLLGPLNNNDGTPRHTDAVAIWEVDHRIYLVWRVLLVLLIAADGIALIMVLVDPAWAK